MPHGDLGEVVGAVPGTATVQVTRSGQEAQSVTLAPGEVKSVGH